MRHPMVFCGPAGNGSYPDGNRWTDRQRGSLADIIFLTKKATTEEDINSILSEASRSTRYEGVLGVTEDPIVSADIIQDPHAAVVDLTMTRAVDGDLVKVLAWYDNEWGYSSQMVRELVRLIG